MPARRRYSVDSKRLQGIVLDGGRAVPCNLSRVVGLGSARQSGGAAEEARAPPARLVGRGGFGLPRRALLRRLRLDGQAHGGGTFPGRIRPHDRCAKAAPTPARTCASACRSIPAPPARDRRREVKRPIRLESWIW